MNQSVPVASHPLPNNNHIRPGSTVLNNQAHGMSINLPIGWRREERSWPNGLSTGRTNVYYISPSGQKVRTKHEMRLLLGDGYDLSSFDWRSGKFSTVTKPNGFEDGSDSTSSKVARLDSLANPFTRRTTPPETFTPLVIRSNPKCKRNDVKNSQHESPQQLFWERRYSGTHAVDPDTGEAYKSISLPRGVQSAGVPGYQSTELMHSLFDAIANKTSPITGQQQQTCLIEKNPCLSINAQQPKVKINVVSDEDVKRQELRVKEIRRKLELARKKLNPRYTCERHG